MLQFKQNETSTRIILTLTELVTLVEPYYLFVFTHVTTKNKVKFIKSFDDDFSNYKDRFNEFEINPEDLFNEEQVGEWHYEVYEQDSDTNEDETLATALLEQGKLLLERATDFAFTMYNQSQSFKTYNG